MKQEEEDDCLPIFVAVRQWRSGMVPTTIC
jgi:hypothetical protein